MLEITQVHNGPIIRKHKEYKESVRTGSSAEKKEEIVSKYPEAYQINIMRKAILGDADAIAELQEIDTFIEGVING